MAITCITYLSFTCFDASIEDKIVIDFVRSGEYCLHQYAESYWLDHVKDAMELQLGNDNSWAESLVPLLNQFVKLRLDEILPHRIDNLKPSGEHQFLGKFSRWPEIQRYLLTYHNFTCGNAGSGVTVGMSTQFTSQYTCRVLYLICICKWTLLGFRYLLKGSENILKIFLLPFPNRTRIKTSFINIMGKIYLSVPEYTARITSKDSIIERKETSI